MVFDGLRLEPPRCHFTFRWGSACYTRVLTFPDPAAPALAAADPAILRPLLGHVGLALAPQLFALADFRRLVVEPLALSPAGVVFLRDLLRDGLAELRYRNGLDPATEVEIEADERRAGPAAEVAGHAGALLLNGGGKDSAVGAEALKAAGVPFTWLAMNPAPAMAAVAAASGRADTLVLRLGGSRRTLARDRRLRGHRPFNSLLAVAGLATAYLTGRRWVVASNERSAGEPTLWREGVAINHQHTKSLAFESAFRRYAAAELLAGVDYFSVLRPLWEVQIGALLARHPEYHRAFLSCNRGLYDGGWCRRCPKCAFTFLLLAAFLPPAEVREILGGDPGASDELVAWVDRLTREEERPFECVGTRGESRLALALAARRGMAVPATWDVPGVEETERLQATWLRDLAGHHHLPPELAPAVTGWFASGLRG
ncbi:MAG TPA: hypothetical protein VHQ65_07860 [Thermoanaerobaculia bacterium]|nr:hypothetical protein [Thermoanaerobaculia bacterium]